MMPSIEEGLSLRVRVDLGGFARREWLPRLLVVEATAGSSAAWM